MQDDDDEDGGDLSKYNLSDDDSKSKDGPSKSESPTKRNRSRSRSRYNLISLLIDVFQTSTCRSACMYHYCSY